MADLHDLGAIPLIADACSRAPKAVAKAIATYLVRFDDVQAQGTVDHFYLHKKLLSIEQLVSLQSEGIVPVASSESGGGLASLEQPFSIMGKLQGAGDWCLLPSG